MLPAYAANALPVIFNNYNFLPSFARPVDFNARLFGKPVFGHSKTFRGFAAGISGALIIGLIQNFLYSIQDIKDVSLIEYSLLNAILISFLLGFGALLGDLVKSFFKRRIGISSGKPWVIFDQTDYAIGALALASIIIIPSLTHIIVIITISALFSIMANIIAYLSGIKKVWW